MPVNLTLSKIIDKVRAKSAAYAERHAPTGFSFAISDRVDGLDHGAWDALTSPCSVFMSRDFVRTLERSGSSNVSPRSALLFRGDEPVAAIAAQRVTVSLGRLPTPGMKRAKGIEIAKAAKIAPLKESIFACGNVLSWGPPAVLADLHPCFFNLLFQRGQVFVRHRGERVRDRSERA
jgi:hypothetical protein